MKGHFIAEGNTAEVFLWGDKEVLKLFRDDFSKEAIDREYRMSKEAQRLGLPVPKVGELIEIEGRNGIIYERISGKSMLEQLFNKPWAVRSCGRKTAEVHYRIHQCQPEGIWKLKDYLTWNIKHSDALSEEKKQEIIAYLEKLPEGNCLCHGDLHPGNLIEISGQPSILDWMTATAGCPAADVARTMLLLKDAELPEAISGFVKVIFQKLRKSIASAYLKRYLQLSGLSLKEVEQWRIPIAAARLMEWIPESEKESLLILINNAKLI